ncbi:hypothetical protein HPP92_013535 [Vanilla planifolia]|uniref:SWIM-type domain-containing protein n=1 Tax=Vanilla planifolia TaxID=51239 RepID=A0A835QX68_VANPL|nr:hypothetical protein HPP92_013535 [Vanilla planifolia]
MKFVGLGRRRNECGVPWMEENTRTGGERLFDWIWTWLRLQMARWDEILTLPVQSPPTLEFSAVDIVWSRVEGWRETMDRLALIPFSRVNDFVRGESNNKGCPTKFHVEARRRRSPEISNKLKVDGILEYILYWCSFGPDDHRKGGVVRPSRSYAAKRKTPAGRPNTKRGCVCHFIVKRLIAEPSVALIIYNQDKHVDKKGLPCHGPQDKKAAGTYAMFAPCFSDELRLQIMSLLYVGVPVETIMQRHAEAVEKQGGPCNRDDLLDHRYVRRLERKIRRSTYKLDSDDAISIKTWVENHQDHVFFYEDFSDSDPFVLGIQTDWQLQQMIQFGNRSLMASDSRFGTNKFKYPIYSLLVFDSKRNAIPVAWIITPRFAGNEMHIWIRALYDRIHSKDPTWKLGGFIVDDPLADINIIREVFKCSVLVSFWRVRHLWHKNLIKRCPDVSIRVEASRRLGEIISKICMEQASLHLFEDFMEDFVDCSAFLEYFKGVWFPKLGAWTDILKALPLASTEVSSAIECYHNQLKLRLLNEDDSSVYQRTDWLVDKLGTKVHSYYWLDEYSGKDNFARYWKDEWKCDLTAWRQALKIPDSSVVFKGNSATVLSDGKPEKMHVVLNPGSEFAICDCSWSNLGNLCEHVIKATKVFREGKPGSISISMFEYKRALANVLHCPPHDSLMHDHAMSLSVSVQVQLNALFGQEIGGSCTGTSFPIEEQVVSDRTCNFNASEPLNGNQVAFPVGSMMSHNGSNHSLQDFETIAETMVVNGMVNDVMPSIDKASSGLVPAVKQLFVVSDNEGERSGREGDLFKEGPSVDSSVSKLSFAYVRPGDDTLEHGGIHDVAIHTAPAEKVMDGSDSFVDERINNGNMDGVEEDRCVSYMTGHRGIVSSSESCAIKNMVFKTTVVENVDSGDATTDALPSRKLQERNETSSTVVTESCSIGDNGIGTISGFNNSYYGINGLGDSCMWSGYPVHDKKGVLSSSSIEPCPGASQAGVASSQNTDEKVYMDIDVIEEEEKICDNSDDVNQKAEDFLNEAVLGVS